MSNNPPFMGARYEAAHDLSEILDDQIRPEQFRPFIPYTLVCVASKMSLDVQAGSTNIGTPLWQYTLNGTDAQKLPIRRRRRRLRLHSDARGTVRDRGCARGHPDPPRGDAGHQAGCEILA